MKNKIINVIYFGIFCMPAAAVESFVPAEPAYNTSPKVAPYNDTLLKEWGGIRNDIDSRL